MKSLYDISWQVDEPAYREDKALSYSTLAKYERGGKFAALPTLFDSTSTPSLTFGSMVDCLITGNEEEFNASFIVLDDPGISSTLREITEQLYERCHTVCHSLDDIPDELIAEVGKNNDFWAADKYYETRVKKIRESCRAYYRMLTLAEGKKVVTEQDVADARKCVEALKTSKDTAKYFEPNDPFNEDIQRFYQLKFKGEHGGIQYRCMADLIVVCHSAKTVLPVDLKTSSHNEWEFPKSFQQWRYDIQARNYWRLIREAMSKDPYFRDFKLLDYRFIVVNRANLKPMVWEFPLTQAVGDIKIDTPTGYKITWRDPYTIGDELHDYLESTPTLPFGSQPVNNIVEWLKNN